MPRRRAEGEAYINIWPGTCHVRRATTYVGRGPRPEAQIRREVYGPLLLVVDPSAAGSSILKSEVLVVVPPVRGSGTGSHTCLCTLKRTYPTY